MTGELLKSCYQAKHPVKLVELPGGAFVRKEVETIEAHVLLPCQAGSRLQQGLYEELNAMRKQRNARPVKEGSLTRAAWLRRNVRVLMLQARTSFPRFRGATKVLAASFARRRALALFAFP